ncbi:MAG: TetR-like C-terminal domain-containing protein [Acidimicrobiales bacterium]
MAEVFAQHPVPDTGDLRRDLEAYLGQLSTVLSSPRGREVIGALVTEASSNEVLMEAFRKKVAGPRRQELIARLQRAPELLGADPSAAVDQLVGPIYYRSLIAGLPLDKAFVRSVVSIVMTPALPARKP